MAVSLDRTSEIVALWQHYRFYDDGGVIASLRRHPELAPLLQQAAAQIPRYFPEDTTLRLQVLDGPDEEDDVEPQLYAVIETELPMAMARSRLYTFDDEWWLSAFRDVISHISLVVE